MAFTGSRAAPKRSSGLARLSVLALGLCLLAAALTPSSTFVAGAGAPRALRRGLTARAAESEESTALVKVTEENKITTVSVIGGLAGLLVGGVWVGAATFIAASYFARQDNEVATALKGVGSGSLEVLNFGSSVNDKYEVTGKVGSAVTDAVENAKKSESTKEVASAVAGAADQVAGAVSSVDKDVGIKDTIGKFATTASDVAAQAVDKAVELNDQYKVTEQVTKKIEEVTKATK